MRTLAAIISVWVAVGAEAAPFIRYESATPKLVVVSVRNEDATPYFYFSRDVDEVPYLVRFPTDKGRGEISSMPCGTGAKWHCLKPGQAIQIQIKERAAFEAPGAVVIPLFFVSEEPEAVMVPTPIITVDEARKSTARKKG